MNRILLTCAVILVGITASFAQCTPDPQYTDPGLFPADSLLPCIERTVAYDEVIQFRNFNTIDGGQIDPNFTGITVTIDSIRIDNISNVPNGLSYACNFAGCIIPGNTNGCVSITGTTSAPAGTYNLGFTATAWVSSALPIAIPPQTLDSATLASVGLGYRLEVIESGAPCRGVAPGGFTVSITGNTEVCPGQTTALTASAVGGGTAPFTYAWSTSQTTAAATVGAGTVTVTITDDNGVTAAGSATVTETAGPSSGFSFSAANDTVTFTNSSTGGVSYTWDFGNGTNSSMENPASAIIYGVADTFTISLVATNSCGTMDTSSLTIITTVPDTTVGIFGRDITNTSIAVYPNPGNGLFNIRMDAGNQNSNFNLSVLAMDGREVYSEDFTGNGGMINRTLSVGEFGKGIYLLYLQSEDLSAVRKLVVQ